MRYKSDVSTWKLHLYLWIYFEFQIQNLYYKLQKNQTFSKFYYDHIMKEGGNLYYI